MPLTYEARVGLFPKDKMSFSVSLGIFNLQLNRDKQTTFVVQPKHEYHLVFNHLPFHLLFVFVVLWNLQCRKKIPAPTRFASEPALKVLWTSLIHSHLLNQSRIHRSTIRLTSEGVQDSKQNHSFQKLQMMQTNWTTLSVLWLLQNLLLQNHRAISQAILQVMVSKLIYF